MYFSDEHLDKIFEKYALLKSKYNALIFAYHGRNYLFPASSEYARHGFMRRVGTLLRCVENTFTILPPGRGDDPPTREELIDATINIQAFVFNVFGAIDNLAWIWVTETQLKKDGASIPNAWVGFGPKNTFVRESLTQGFRSYLLSMDSWFDHLENFRHALAHRVPLYIPPYIVHPKREEEWRQFETKIMDAMRRGDAKAEEELKESQKALCKFRPWMIHSYSGGSRPVVFHAQLIADFMTVEEMALKLLPELPS
jgi:hypothetical protein